MPVPFLLPLIIGGASKVIGSVIQGRAAGKAAEQQQQAAREAMTVAGQQAAQARADLQPLRAAGTTGLTSLTSLLGLPAYSTALPPAGGGPRPVPPGAARTPSPDAQYTGYYAVPRGTLPNPGGTPLYPAGGMVMLRAPNGQTKAVPPHQVDFYLSRGATRM